MKRGPKIICLRRKVIAAVGCVAVALLMCWVAASPKVVGAASTERQLPIYCVQKDYKVLSISFDAAWGDVRVRQEVADGNAIFLSECLMGTEGFSYGMTQPNSMDDAFSPLICLSMT